MHNCYGLEIAKDDIQLIICLSNALFNKTWMTEVLFTMKTCCKSSLILNRFHKAIKLEFTMFSVLQYSSLKIIRDIFFIFILSLYLSS